MLRSTTAESFGRVNARPTPPFNQPGVILTRKAYVDGPEHHSSRKLSHLALKQVLRSTSQSWLACGGPELRVYPVGFGLQTVRMMPRLMTRGRGQPLRDIQSPVDGPEVFHSMTWSDWEEARLTEVLVYLRGSTSLSLPPEWRAVFPTAV